MGYRSEVAYAIQFKERSDLDAFIAGLPDGDYEALLQDGLTVDGNTLRFHDTDTKWYATRIVGKSAALKDVDRHENLIDAAERASWEDVPMVGVFVRLGEEYDDAEENWWGESDDRELPSPWDLVHIDRGIAVGWE